MILSEYIWFGFIWIAKAFRNMAFGGGISTEEKLGVMSEEYEIPVVNEFVKDIARVREILEPLQKDEDLVK